MQGAGGQFEDLLAKVGTLREKLNVLEDSEEELVEGRASDYAKDGNDTDDKPDEPDETDESDSDLDDPKNQAAKAKPKQKAKGKPKTDDKSEDADEDQSLTGPERPEPPKGPSALGGEEEGLDRGSRATGPSEARDPRPTTLGDPTEIAQAAETLVPRWRRSDG